MYYEQDNAKAGEETCDPADSPKALPGRRKNEYHASPGA
jgi:hypothetical protein